MILDDDLEQPAATVTRAALSPATAEKPSPARTVSVPLPVTEPKA